MAKYFQGLYVDCKGNRGTSVVGYSFFSIQVRWVDCGGCDPICDRDGNLSGVAPTNWVSEPRGDDLLCG